MSVSGFFHSIIKIKMKRRYQDLIKITTFKHAKRPPSHHIRNR